MRRLLPILALLGVVLMLNAQGQEPDIIDWQKYTPWQEKSLHDETSGGRTYRQLFGSPYCGGSVLARLVVKADGSGDLVLKVQEIEKPSSIVRNARQLDSADVNRFLTSVDRAQFWALPSNETVKRYKDAAICTLEGRDRGTYHGVRREVASDHTAFDDACTYFVKDAMTEMCRRRRMR